MWVSFSTRGSYLKLTGLIAQYTGSTVCSQGCPWRRRLRWTHPFSDLKPLLNSYDIELWQNESRGYPLNSLHKINAKLNKFFPLCRADGRDYTVLCGIHILIIRPGSVFFLLLFYFVSCLFFVLFVKRTRTTQDGHLAFTQHLSSDWLLYLNDVTRHYSIQSAV